MKQYAIVWRPKARADILALYDWIAEQAGPLTAFEYTSKIEIHTEKLANFPDRGTPRNDLGTGLRTMPYQRRTVIAYRVMEEAVEILRVVHGGMDVDGLFEND